MKLFLYDNLANCKKIYKDKLKDRHKIKGIKFDYSKREVKRYLLSQNEKNHEEIMKEKEENLLFKNYNKLKHQIFVREKEEKDESKKDANNNKISTSFTYTNLMKILQKYLSAKYDKNKENPFNYNLKKGKLEIELINRNLKRNRINASLQKIVLHYKKVKSKLETRLNKEGKLFFSEEMAEKLKNKIQTQRKRISSRNKFSRKSNTFLIDLHFDNESSKNSNLFIINNKEKQSKNISSNFNESITNKTNTNNTLKLSTYQTGNINKMNLRKKKNSSSSIQLYTKIIHSEDQKRKKENNLKKTFINNEKINKMQYGNNKETMFENGNTIIKNKKITLNSTNFTNFTLNTKKVGQGNKNTLEPSEILTEDYNTMKLIKKYNSNYAKKNYKKKKFFNRPQSCINTNNKNKFRSNFNESSLNNKNFIRSSSGVKKKSFLKVMNKPIYTTNIKDLINEYDKIKSNIKKLKKNYEEKHFSTYKEIDHLLEIKEDMLMFLLKQKFFKSKFRPKPGKNGKTKTEFINKMKDYVEILEEKPKDLYINFDDFFKL